MNDWHRTFQRNQSVCSCRKDYNVGLIEVPMGTTLREVIYEIGGGIKGGKKFKLYKQEDRQAAV